MSEPLPDWERELLTEPFRRRHDAGALEEAAAVVRERFRHTFALRVVVSPRKTRRNSFTLP